MTELAARISIRNFIDHGPNVQPAAATDDFLQRTYPQLYAKAKHTVAEPGMKIPIAGLDVLVVTSAGETIKAALGDLTKNKEFELMCPNNRIANVLDEPLAAMPVTPVTAPPPGPDAPPAPVHNGTAYWIKVSAQSDGSFTVTNGRNGFSKIYRR
jgi:hypothetical protein